MTKDCEVESIEDQVVAPLREAWEHPNGQWDANCMLFGIGPGDRDPHVPSKDRFDPAHWRAIIDAEGDLICLAPAFGPWDQANWPEYLVKILNAFTDAADPILQGGS